MDEYRVAIRQRKKSVAKSCQLILSFPRWLQSRIGSKLHFIAALKSLKFAVNSGEIFFSCRIFPSHIIQRQHLRCFSDFLADLVFQGFFLPVINYFLLITPSTGYKNVSALSLVLSYKEHLKFGQDLPIYYSINSYKHLSIV